MESRISKRKTYLIEIMYHENHNTEAVTITTDNINWSMQEYQRNRKPFAWEILDWKQEIDERKLQDQREIDVRLVFSKAYLIFINMFKKKKNKTASELQSTITSESTTLKSRLIAMVQLFFLMFKNERIRIINRINRYRVWCVLPICEYR